jgi:23S rRNA (cytidine1920-2'-O)/16S rRNA (cytidine1409-2'-O)-methyltransferase
MTYVSRAGLKLQHGLDTFGIEPHLWVCADLGSNTGGFVDCLLSRGASKVYAVERGYGVLDWKLRKDPRVVTMERTNAMHVSLPENVQLVTVDVSWTKQKNILPNAAKLLVAGGQIVTLIKPHYEAPKNLIKNGFLPHDEVQNVVDGVILEINGLGFEVLGLTQSPIQGDKGGNTEYLAWVVQSTPSSAEEA